MPLRLWYAGPQFRYERPQAGRYREFRQIGAELLGVPGPAAEVEILTMLFSFLEALGFKGLVIAVNSVGTARSRDEFGKALQGYLAARSEGFGEDDRRKLAENPLRLFDSKDPAVREALEGSPRTLDFLDGESKEHHEEVRRLLGAAGIPLRDEPSLVRGLDYYTRTVFEVVSSELGAQDAILGGGRYDNLVESLGGPPLPAIGFAIGEDRLVQVAPRPAASGGLVLALPQGPDDLDEILKLARDLRSIVPWPVEVDLLARGFKKGMARANALLDEAAARGLEREKIFAILLGSREREAGTVTIKKLASGEQETLPQRDVAAWLAGRM
jgi:histidyl-tRNA synthetase